MNFGLLSVVIHSWVSVHAWNFDALGNSIVFNAAKDNKKAVKTINNFDILVNLPDYSQIATISFHNFTRKN